jgi:hypothetical protein
MGENQPDNTSNKEHSENPEVLQALKEAGKSYPFNDGEYGIPFSNLEATNLRGEPIRSGFGRLINIDANQSQLYIHDDKIFHFFMESQYFSIHAGEIRFDIRTKRTGKYGRTVRHPDMRAKYYLELACNYYQNLGLPVTTIRGRWNYGSENRAQFMEVYKESNDPVLAAKSTWIGHRAAELGFIHVQIHLPPLFKLTGGDVEAFFMKE